jgi:hypothetical protein
MSFCLWIEVEVSMQEIALDIAGLGIILYSPTAVVNILMGSNYLEEHFTKPSEVAQHVMDCHLTTFCTGTPGRFRIRFSEGFPDEVAVQAAAFKLRLGLLVQDKKICVRDLYDLYDWSPECPPRQQVSVADGWYRLTVVSSPPASGILGDGQIIDICLEPVGQKPLLNWFGVPNLC